MSENKRLGPAELLQQQEERERSARDAEVRAREKEAADRMAREIAENEKTAAQIKASWYDDVVAATKRDGVRFLVLAETIGSSGDVHRIVRDLVATVKAGGFTCEETHVEPAVTPGAASRSMDMRDGKEALVTDRKGVTGWKPAKLPRIGSQGEVSQLVVRWGR